MAKKSRIQEGEQRNRFNFFQPSLAYVSTAPLRRWHKSTVSSEINAVFDVIWLVGKIVGQEELEREGKREHNGKRETSIKVTLQRGKGNLKANTPRNYV